MIRTQGAYLCLWPDVEEVEAVDVGRDVGIHGIVAKHTHSPALGELAILIVEVLCEG